MTQRFLIQFLFLSSLVGSAQALADDSPGNRVPSTMPATAKDLFYKPDAAPAGTTALAMRHQLYLQRGSERGTVPDGFAFQTGDRIKLLVQVNQPGFLYVLHRGSSGEWKFLFPDPKLDRGNHAVKALEPRAIPDDGWFEFDARTGREELYLFFSKERIREFHLASSSQSEPTFRITVEASVIQQVVARHDDQIRRGAAKDIVHVDDSANADGGAAADDVGPPACPERPEPRQTATYTTSVSIPADGTAIRSLSLHHAK